MPSYQPKSKPKIVTQKQYRALHNGHYFVKSGFNDKTGGTCECGLRKRDYTLKKCMGMNVPECTKQSKGK